jgi:hypothetical protein
VEGHWLVWLYFICAIKHFYSEEAGSVFCFTHNSEHERAFCVVFETAPGLNGGLTNFDYLWLVILTILRQSHILSILGLRPVFPVPETSSRVDNHCQIKVSVVVGVGCGFVYQNGKVPYGVRVDWQIEVLALIVRDSSLKIVLVPGNVARHVAKYDLVILIYFQVKFVCADLVIYVALDTDVDATV